jgi:hypothetical protein
MRMPRLFHGEFIGCPSGWTPAGEQDHILECPVCGQTFDMRDLGQALDHWHDGPADDRGGPLAKLKRVTAVWRGWVPATLSRPRRGGLPSLRKIDHASITERAILG